LSLNLSEKKAVIALVSKKIATAQTIVLAEYRGIQANHLTQLRADARAQGVHLCILKNSLAQQAVKDTVFSDLASQMTGPLIYSISEDAISAAKIVNDFARNHNAIVIKTGNYAGKSLDKAAVLALASIPNREVLLSQVIGMMQFPLAGLARSLAALALKKEEVEAIIS
jgi:large subunit ribosomal protein L10